MKVSITCVLMVLVPSLVLCEDACIDRHVMQHFNFTLFQGEWNVLMATVTSNITKCLQQIFQENDQNSTMTLYVAEQYGSQFVPVTYDGVIWKTETPGKLEFTMINETPAVNVPYWVLDTDYVNYAVTYICWRQSRVRDYVTVLGRRTSLSVEARTAVNAVLEKINLAPERLEEVPHTNCPSKEPTVP